ncbi:MAG: polysaccharide deacetylase family protein [Marinilabiliales bacterium]
MVWVHPPKIASRVFFDIIWEYPNDNNIYLTFDDGPVPGVTDWVLDVLNDFNIKATFFCLGSNAEKHPQIFKRIIKENHLIGSHGYNHLNGWKTKNKIYFDDIESASNVLNTNYYRPPYGKIKPSQIRILKKQMKIIMWSLLSRDFDVNSTPEQCYNNVIDNIKGGSIIVFHDSYKAEKNLKGSLIKIIEELISKYSFGVIH